MKDKYDEQIERLLAAEDFRMAVSYDWSCGVGLFQYCTPRGHTSHGALRDCGCPTMVRSGAWPAWTGQLTAAIMADTRLPDHVSAITPEHLPIFAEWQRRLDKEIRQELAL